MHTTLLENQRKEYSRAAVRTVLVHGPTAVRLVHAVINVWKCDRDPDRGDWVGISRFLLPRA